MILTGEDEQGINGGMMRKRDEQSLLCNTISIFAVDEYLDRIVANKGTVVVQRMAIPGIVWQAYFKDLDSNFFGVHQEDPGAK
jgi:hypothetical protein